MVSYIVLSAFKKKIEMGITEFKNKLDKREFWGVNSKQMWDAAYKWQEQVNGEDSLMKWRWDCGLKLDYDGDVCRISSRFYPPHKSSAEYGKYHGTISVMIGDAEEDLHNYEVEADTLDELKTKAEEYVSKTMDKIHDALMAIF